MDIRATTDSPLDTGADTIVVGVFDGKGIPHDVDDGALGALVESGEARSSCGRSRSRTPPGSAGSSLGGGSRDDFDGERARLVAATALGRARELGARSLCWELPHKVADAVAGAIVEGTLLAAYRYAAFKSEPGEDRAPGELIVSAHHDVARAVERGRVGGGGRQPRARPQERAAERADAGGAGRARAGAAGRRGRGDGPGRDRGRRDGRVRRGRAGLDERAAPDHVALRPARRRPGRCSASSARR